jgi:hypothetical protein
MNTLYDQLTDFEEAKEIIEAFSDEPINPLEHLTEVKDLVQYSTQPQGTPRPTIDEVGTLLKIFDQHAHNPLFRSAYFGDNRLEETAQELTTHLKGYRKFLPTFEDEEHKQTLIHMSSLVGNYNLVSKGLINAANPSSIALLGYTAGAMVIPFGVSPAAALVLPTVLTGLTTLHTLVGVNPATSSAAQMVHKAATIDQALDEYRSRPDFIDVYRIW